MNNRSFDRNDDRGFQRRDDRGGFDRRDNNRGGGERREFTPADKLKKQLRDADMRIFIGNPKKFTPKSDKLPIIVIDSWKEGKEWIVITDSAFDAEAHVSNEVITSQNMETTFVQEEAKGFTWTTYTIK